MIELLKKYVFNLLALIAWICALIFLVPFFVSLYFTIMSGYGGTFPIAYLMSFATGVSFLISYHWVIWIFAALMLLVEQLKMMDRPNILKRSGLGFVFGLGLIWILALAYFYTQSAVVSESNWSAKVEFAQFVSPSFQKQVSAELCEAIKSEVSSESDSFAAHSKQIDDFMQKIGFEPAFDELTVERGYINYYFKVPKGSETNLVVDQAKTALQRASIGSTYYWLHKDWYEENALHMSGEHLRPTVTLRKGIISVRFETLFPALADYTDKGILNDPPSHLLNTMKAEGFEYFSSERTDPLTFVYSVPVPFYKLKGRNYNVRLKLEAVKTQGGYENSRVVDYKCAWPSYGLKHNSPGDPPLDQRSFPPEISEVQLCNDLDIWNNCQAHPESRMCSLDKYKVGAPKPNCYPLNIPFGDIE